MSLFNTAISSSYTGLHAVIAMSSLNKPGVDISSFFFDTVYSKQLYTVIIIL